LIMLNPYEILFKLLLGTLLGGLIGFERQTHGRAAGFRTQLLVCVACVLLMIISDGFAARSALHPEFIRVDPTRIASGALAGIGFLGAGVILKMGFNVQGLTTAACIWVVSAIGLAIGSGQYFASVVTFAITFFALWVLRIWETKMPRRVYKYVKLVTDESGDETKIRAIFMERGLRVIRADYGLEPPKKEKTYDFTIALEDEGPLQDVMDAVASEGFVKKLEIRS
jgi:putative Mg2+ transporter-C (MgtC) family protein